MLCELASVLAGPLTYLFNLCLSSGKCPSAWKRTIIRPLYKNGSKSHFNNYRPISNTSIFSHIIEKIVVSRIQAHFEGNNLWHSAQHGFRKRRSCNTQLLEVICDFQWMADNGILFDCIYIDFSKAFEKISIPLLINKCQLYGIGPQTKAWITDYLTNRTQEVAVGDALSSPMSVISGVPQGSCLGPVLFCLFINDLPGVVRNSTIKMFADDVKIYRPVMSEHEISLLQEDLVALGQWCTANSMFINETKCNAVHYLRRLPQHYHYFVVGKLISSVEYVCDLGICFDSSLKFNKHVSDITHKANYQLLRLRRTFSKFNLHSLISLYVSTVRPVLEYCSSVWYPLNKRDRERVERVQCRATKLIPYLSHLPYHQRMQRLQLPSLQFRRDRAVVINTFRIVRNIDNITPTHFFTFTEYSSTRQHQHKIYPPCSQKRLGQNSLSSRVWKTWNSLPSEIVASTTVQSFKSSLASTDFYTRSYHNPF